MRYDMSRQEKIDRVMCKPGYTWNETLQKCLGAGGGAKPLPNDGVSKPPPMPTPDQAVQEEIASRETTGEVL